MQTFKIIFGIIIGISALNVTIIMSEEEKGAGLAGAFSGFLILGGLSAWLIYSGSKGNKKNEK